jgi:glutamate racemase
VVPPVNSATMSRSIGARRETWSVARPAAPAFFESAKVKAAAIELTMTDPPNILVFDSGLGGLTVLTEIRKLLHGVNLVYAADDAAFPYGARSEVQVIQRVEEMIEWLIASHRPDLICIACNTASTVALKPLRSRFPKIPFVGTVPAIKPAAKLSRSKMITVLATPGTVAREYTRELVREYAADCIVELVGSQRLASLAETYMQGGSVDDQAVAAEIAPCFQSLGERRTDAVVLACTHYPLLSEHFQRLAPWPVDWIDPAAAIARRVLHVLSEQGYGGQGNGERLTGPFAAIFSSGRTPLPSLAKALRGHDLVEAEIALLPCPPLRAAVDG